MFWKQKQLVLTVLCVGEGAYVFSKVKEYTIQNCTNYICAISPFYISRNPVWGWMNTPLHLWLCQVHPLRIVQQCNTTVPTISNSLEHCTSEKAQRKEISSNTPNVYHYWLVFAKGTFSSVRRLYVGGIRIQRWPVLCCYSSQPICTRISYDTHLLQHTEPSLKQIEQ